MGFKIDWSKAVGHPLGAQSEADLEEFREHEFYYPNSELVLVKKAAPGFGGRAIGIQTQDGKIYPKNVTFVPSDCITFTE